MGWRADIRGRIATGIVRLLIPLSTLTPVRAQESAPARSVPPSVEIQITLTPALRDSLIRLDHQFILAGSDSLKLPTGERLRRGVDYSINYREGIVRLTGASLDSLLGSKPGWISLTYAYLPFRFESSYSRRRLEAYRDTTRGDTVRIARPTTTLTVDDIFGPNLQKSGSLFRGFNVGSTRDFTPTAGLRMQLSGKIASDVEVSAALSDENTPLQPEGTTQTLQEFDKVFMEIRSPVISATLGDFSLEYSGSEFGRLNRKLTGARGTVDYRGEEASGSVTVAGAVERGKFTTNQFPGTEGVQGPYRLSGRNGERPIIVIAGTEKVYVDGLLQVRGEVNDYIIDYGTAEVTFRPRRLITSYSRITVDFEYTDQKYARSLVSGKATSSLFSEKANLSVSYFREGDDPDTPLDIAIPDSARAILESAGGDRDKAVISGVSRVDSNGLYVAVDTLVASQSVRYYRYAPGDSAALYTVEFSYVGTGKGDYTRQQAGVYVWQGTGKGDYAPVIYLPLPQLQQILDFTLEAVPLPELRLTGEYAASSLNANRLSSLPDASSNGHAFTFLGSYLPRSIRIGGADVGDVDLAFKERYMNAQFVPMDRINEIEFRRKWAVDSLRQGDEEIREASIRYRPISSLAVGGEYGSYRRGSDLESERIVGSAGVRDSTQQILDYVIEKIDSRDQAIGLKNRWVRQLGNASYALSSLIPSIRYEAEDRSITGLTDGISQPGSLKFHDIGAGVVTRELGRLTLSANLSVRQDWAYRDSTVEKQSRSLTQTYSGRLREWNNLGGALDVVVRDRAYTQAFKQDGLSDINTILVRTQLRYSPFQRAIESEVYYEVSTQKTSRLQRVFIPVPKGTGNYIYLGDLNSNGVADEFEFQQTRFDGDYVLQTYPSDALFPVIDLNTSFRLRLSPARAIPASSGFLASLLAPITTDTYFRVQERSMEPDKSKILLLDFDAFQQDSTTISGFNLFSQDLLFFEGDPVFSLRLRYLQRNGMSNFVSGIERAFAKERSVRLRLSLVREIANQLDISEKTDRLTGAYESERFHNIINTTLSYDLSYRPQQRFELGFRLELSKAEDQYPEKPLTADINIEGVRAVYAFEGSGQARVEFSREETRLGRAAVDYAYELTGGRLPGLTWLWRAAFDYRFVGFLQAGASYDGRTEGGRPPVHTVSAEIRAYF